MSKAINYGTQKGIFVHYWPMLRVIVLLFSSWMFLLRITSSLSLNHNSCKFSGCRPPLPSRSQHCQARNPEDPRPWGWWQQWGAVPWIILIKFQKILSESIDADYDKVNFQDKHGCDIQEYNKSDINDIY